MQNKYNLDEDAMMKSQFQSMKDEYQKDNTKLMYIISKPFIL